MIADRIGGGRSLMLWQIEQRQAKRRIANEPGCLTFSDGRRLDCIVVDVSDTGAKLRFQGPCILPNRFALTIGVRKAGNVRLVWRLNAHVGVAFERS
jgi:hypothetical protein